MTEAGWNGTHWVPLMDEMGEPRASTQRESGDFYFVLLGFSVYNGGIFVCGFWYWKEEENTVRWIISTVFLCTAHFRFCEEVFSSIISFDIWDLSERQVRQQGLRLAPLQGGGAWSSGVPWWNQGKTAKRGEPGIPRVHLDVRAYPILTG